MAEGIYWTTESWGSDCPPVNADEIINTANCLIDEYITEHHLDLDFIMEFRDAFDYSSMLWEDFCSTGSINGITAIYEEE